MLKTTLAISIVMLAGTALAAEYAIDPAHTYPHFRISHLGFSTMQGRFNSTRGKLVFDPEQKLGQVEVVIDASSIDTGHQVRDDDLRSPDYLNVVEFPEITFKSTEVQFEDGGKIAVIGDLTILGVTKAVTLEVSRVNCGVHPFNGKDVCGFDASTRIKRSEFGMTYAIGNIGDDMELNFEVEGFKQ